MKPLVTTVVTRPFHWGIVVVADPTIAGEAPDLDPGLPVTANVSAIVIRVRHAQDVPSFESDFDWAEVSLTVRLLAAAEPPGKERRVLYSGRIRTPSGRLGLGDADGEVVVPSHQGITVVTVSVDRDVPEDDLSPASVNVDLVRGSQD